MYDVIITHVVPKWDVTSIKVNGLNLPRVRLGAELFFRIEVRDLSSATQALVAPTSVKLTLRRPDGVLEVNNAAMSTASTGIYTYAHQSAATDTPGVWQVSFECITGGTTVLTPPRDAVEMVP